MAKRYDVMVRVVSQNGNCGAGHKVGDEWLIKGKTPEGMCLSAFNALYPSARVLMLGGTFPWEAASDVTTVACPDAANPVVFEVKRLRQ
ncbi:MAG: TIGR04076 family protein [Chloroflexi bacterium]|nr:TIGR04076 family protein [Chloroflexota bacterium]